MLHLDVPRALGKESELLFYVKVIFLDCINQNFSDYFIAGKNICIDESMIKIKNLGPER